MTHKLIIGTRGSVLALWQARYIQARLEKELGILSELKIVKTKGDKFLDAPLVKIGGKGLFTKELEELLLNGEIDLAVHSLKDVPVDFIKGLELVCITKREDVRDCLLSQKYNSLETLPLGARVGTTSLRRLMQLLVIRPDISSRNLRGNIQTRLQKLKNEEFEAIILAQAGVNRLGIDEQNIKYIVPLSQTLMISAMGQGALGVEMRTEHALFEKIKKLNDKEASLCCGLERLFVRVLEGGCQVPIGVNAKLIDDKIHIDAIIGLPDGSKVLKDSIEGKISEGKKLTERLAEQFIQKGAKELLLKAQNMAFI